MPSSVKSINVLLIENDGTDAKSILGLLEQNRCETVDLTVSWSTCLADGLLELSSHQYDAVLLNLGLPDSDGLNTLERLRRHSKTLPIVVLSGTDDKEFALQVVQSGAQDYLVKGRPSGESIFRSIRYAIERCRADHAVTQLKIVEEREHFIAMLAHNLSIPIIGAQRILSIVIELGTLPADIRHLLMQISNSNQTLLRTINNVLDLYKYDAHHDHFVQTEVNANRLVSDCLREVADEAAMKNIRFVKLFAADDVLWADPLAMRKVLLNLITNAIKFTPAGGKILISVRLAAGKTILRVTDNGVGVEPELLEFIFDRSVQRGSRYVEDGFGLGLDLCKKFVEAQSGQITCFSKPNQGTTFEITLPQAPYSNGARINDLKVRLLPKLYVKV